jgi:hypothetical protein
MTRRQLQEQAAALFALAEDAFGQGKPQLGEQLTALALRDLAGAEVLVAIRAPHAGAPRSDFGRFFIEPGEIPPARRSITRRAIAVFAVALFAISLAATGATAATKPEATNPAVAECFKRSGGTYNPVPGGQKVVFGGQQRGI